jgi:hypothetical protein
LALEPWAGPPVPGCGLLNGSAEGGLPDEVGSVTGELPPGDVVTGRPGTGRWGRGTGRVGGVTGSVWGTPDGRVGVGRAGTEPTT